MMCSRHRPTEGADSAPSAEGRCHADHSGQWSPAWECGSCGAVIDIALVEPGELYHRPDADCRSAVVLA